MNLFKKLYGYLPEGVKRNIIMAKHRRFDLKSHIDTAHSGALEVEKTVIILGMHRSGTSLTGEVLKELGVNLGKRLKEAEKENPRGFFENNLVVKMNDKILAMAGGTWDNPPERANIAGLRQDRGLMEEVEALVRSQEDTVWGWKDPRSVLTIELYLPFLKNPYFIFCHRDDMAIAKSINKRNGTPVEDGLQLAREYKKRMNDFSASLQHAPLHIRYDDYFSDSKAQVGKIGRYLGLDKQIDTAIIDKKLKHF